MTHHLGITDRASTVKSLIASQYVYADSRLGPDPKTLLKTGGTSEELNRQETTESPGPGTKQVRLIRRRQSGSQKWRSEPHCLGFSRSESRRQVTAAACRLLPHPPRHTRTRRVGLRRAPSVTPNVRRRWPRVLVVQLEATSAGIPQSGVGLPPPRSRQPQEQSQTCHIER
jgi:hypothetical protein